MRRLLLLRHAKSSWDQAPLDDISRPLAPRGRTAAPMMGRHIRGRGLLPDLVLCSTAERARQTLELVIAEWDQAADDGAKVAMRASLYLATVGDLMGVLKRLDDDVQSVMIIGHNPGMAVLAERLAATGNAKDMKRLAKKYPTAALAVIDLDIARWKDVAPGSGSLQSFVRPKDLR